MLSYFVVLTQVLATVARSLAGGDAPPLMRGVSGPGGGWGAAGRGGAFLDAVVERIDSMNDEEVMSPTQCPRPASQRRVQLVRGEGRGVSP